MSLVIARLKKYNLENYNNKTPIIFIDAEDPDDACYKAYHKLSSKILKQGHSIETIDFCKDIMNDLRIIKVEVANEKKL